MNSTTHPHNLRYHTWRDVGGFFGLVLDGAFCAFVMFAAFLMLAFCSVLLVLDYLVSPLLMLSSRFKKTHAAP